MGQQIESLARFAAETPWEAIPAAVQEHAKLVVLDTLGVVLAGSEQPEVEKLRTQLVATGGTGTTIWARGFPSSDLRTAALLNGIAGRSIEMCDGHRITPCHGGVQILPAALGIGEGLGSSGREVLEALVMGYEVAVRIGVGVKARSMSHPNGQWALLGAVAAGAKMRGFSAKQLSKAIRVCAVLVLTPSYTNAVQGGTGLNVAGGMSAFAGTLGPELALAGFETQPEAIEEAFTALVGDGFNPEPVTEEMGQRWEITRLFMRLRACCNPIHPALDALDAALAELRPTPDQIERVDMETFAWASAMRNQQPRNYFAAKYSFPHAAAATIVRGNAGYESFTEALVHDPTIVALRERVHVREDPDLSTNWPQLKQARVTLTLKDGRTSTHFCEGARGDFLRPYPSEEMRGKFRQLAGLVLTAEGVAEVESLVDRFDSVDDVRELTTCLRRHAR